MGILECGTPLPGVVLSSTDPHYFADTKEDSNSRDLEKMKAQLWTKQKKNRDRIGYEEVCV